MWACSFKWKLLSHGQLFVTPWPIQSMEFSRPEYSRPEDFLSPGDLPNLGIKPRSSALRGDSLPAEPQGKPKNTEVGSLLQQIFLTQESTRGFLHCRQTLYQLNYQGSLHVLLNWSQKRTFLFNKWKLCYSFGILYILRRRKNFR